MDSQRQKTSCDIFGNPFYNTVASVMADAAGVDARDLGRGDVNTKSQFYVYMKTEAFATMVIDIAESMLSRSDELMKHMRNQ